MAEDSNLITVIRVEILQKLTSIFVEDKIIALVSEWLSLQHINNCDGIITEFNDETLSEHISSISIQSKRVDATQVNLPKVFFYVYRFNSTSPEIQESEDECQISTQWILPTADFNGLWESLVYDFEIKENLLNYVSTALHFSEKQIDPNIISWNRIVLLHGPPGTGKTSLCKALAQKISIRFSSKFDYGQLVEVNTHSLFSKWFSESGKLVTKMFHNILSLVEDTKVLVIVLLDEVETLARSRTSSLSGNEPSDGLRAVNALLTHLDMIKRYPNVLILTTSNITEAIDIALVDRADIKQFIGLPSVEAIYHIYSSCIKELYKAGLIYNSGVLMPFNAPENFVATNEGLTVAQQRNMKLKFISEQSVGLSGRSLRKMPFIAYSLLTEGSKILLDSFLEALSKAVEMYWIDVKAMKAPP